MMNNDSKLSTEKKYLDTKEKSVIKTKSIGKWVNIIEYIINIVKYHTLRNLLGN